MTSLISRPSMGTAIHEMAHSMPARLMEHKNLPKEVEEWLSADANTRIQFYTSTEYEKKNLAQPGQVVKIDRLESGETETLLMMGTPIKKNGQVGKQILDSSSAEWIEVCLSEAGVTWKCPEKGWSQLKSVESLENSVEFATELYKQRSTGLRIAI